MDSEQRLPTPDGGLEVISTAFKHPSQWLSSFRNKEITLMPPQYYILTTLSQTFENADSKAACWESLKRLSEGNFGKMVINPVGLRHHNYPKMSYLTYEGDEARGEHAKL
jgi:hypothetical protein